jgi:hypothetical protein
MKCPQCELEFEDGKVYAIGKVESCFGCHIESGRLENSGVDLRVCRIGDTLISKHGTELTYLGLERKYYSYPAMRHAVQYPDGSHGNRTDNGQVYANVRMEGDEDIVKVIHHVNEGQYDAQVHDVYELDHEYQTQFNKDWLLVLHNNTIIQYDTEDEACDAQVEYRKAWNLNPETGE